MFQDLSIALCAIEAKICKRTSKAGGDEMGDVENLCMVLWVVCKTSPLWRDKDWCH